MKTYPSTFEIHDDRNIVSGTTREYVKQIVPFFGENEVFNTIFFRYILQMMLHLLRK